MNMEVFHQIMAPTMAKKGVALVIITSKQNKYNYISKLLEKRLPNGEPLFTHVEFKLVCERCKKLGRGISCRCLMYKLPNWLGAGQYDKMHAIMGDKIFMTESMGDSVDDTQEPAFDPDSIDDVKQYCGYCEDVNHVFVTIDPACSGDRSRIAFVSCIYPEDESMVIVAADYSDAKDPESAHVDFEDHIRIVRRITGLENAVVVIAPESNLGWEAYGYVNSISLADNLGERVIMSERRKGREVPGLLTTDSTKEMIAADTKALLDMRRVYVHRHFRSASKNPEAVLDRLMNELRGYMRITEPCGLNNSDVRIRFSGKMGASGRDDMAIALQINTHARKLFFEDNKKYGRFY